MRWKFAYYILLTSCIAGALENGRPKRDLHKLKNLVTSSLLKWKKSNSTPPNYKLYRIPGFDTILLKALPKVPKKVVQVPVTIIMTPEDTTANIINSYLGSQTTNDTIKALDEIKTLLELGILSDKQDDMIKEIAMPMLKIPLNKFTETEVNKTLTMKTSSLVPTIAISKTAIVRNAPIQASQVISVVPDPTKYSYKQITNDSESTTFVSKYEPNTVIATTKKVPKLPQYIKMRIQKAALVGINPYRYVTPETVLASRPPLMIKEIIKYSSVPSHDKVVPAPGEIYFYQPPVFTSHQPEIQPYIAERFNQSYKKIKPLSSKAFFQPGVIDVNGPSIVSGGARPPVLVKETLRVPEMTDLPSRVQVVKQESEIDTYGRIGFSGGPEFVKEAVKVPGVPTSVGRSPIYFKEIGYISSPLPGMNNFYDQPITTLARSPVIFKETVKVPAYLPGVTQRVVDVYGPSGLVRNFRPSILVKETVKVPRINPFQAIIDTRGSVNIRVNNGHIPSNTQNSINNDAYNEKHRNGIPPPPTLSEGHENYSKEDSRFSVYKKGTNKFLNTKQVPTTNVELSTKSGHEGTLKNVTNFTFKGTENRMAGIPSPLSLEKNHTNGFSYNFVSKKHNATISSCNTTKIQEKNTSNEISRLNNGIPAFSFTANKTENSRIVNKTMSKINSPKIKNKTNIKTRISTTAQNSNTNDSEEQLTSLSTLLSRGNTNFNHHISSVTHGGNADTIVHRGDIPSFLGYENNEDTEKSKSDHIASSVSSKKESNVSSKRVTPTGIQHVTKNNGFSGIPPPSHMLPNDSFNVQAATKGVPMSSYTAHSNSLTTNTVQTKKTSNVNKIRGRVSLPHTRSREKIFTKLDNRTSSPSNTVHTSYENIHNTSYKTQKENENSQKFTSEKHANDNVYSNKTSDVSIQSEFSSGGEEVEKELISLRKNKNPSKAFIEAQTNLNQIENRFGETSNKERTSDNSEIDFASPNKVNNEVFSTKNTLSSAKLIVERDSNYNTQAWKSDIVTDQIKTTPSKSNFTVTSTTTPISIKFGGIVFGTRMKIPTSSTIRKSSNRKTSDRFSLNPERKQAINKLIGGRNDTISAKIETIGLQSVSINSQKQSTNIVNSNDHFVNNNRSIMISRRNKRDISRVFNRIPSHYLYVPPVDIDVPPPVRPLKFIRTSRQDLVAPNLNSSEVKTKAAPVISLKLKLNASNVKDKSITNSNTIVLMGDTGFVFRQN